MPLWGNNAFANNSNAPKYANVNSDFSGLRYGSNSVYGVKTGEKANTQGQGPNVAHSGWVYFDLGRGPLAGLQISGGQGYNANGYLSISGGGGSGANVSYVVGNAQTAAVGFSSNSQQNTIVSFVINNGGSGYNAAPTIQTLGITVIANATYTPILGGRGGRPQSEVLVAMSTITGDVSTGNIHFPGVV
jgi:hypothetical protein